MGKKIAITIGVIAVLVLGVLGGYYLNKNYGKKKESKPTATPTAKVEETKIWTKEELSTYLIPIMNFAKGKEAYYPDQLSDDTVFETCVRLLMNDDIKKEFDNSDMESLKKENETGLLRASDIKTLAKRYFNRDNFELASSGYFTYDKNRDAYYTTNTFGWTDGGEQAFQVTDVKQNKEDVTVLIDGYYDPNAVKTGAKDTTYQANLTCDKEACHIKSIVKS